MKVEDKVFVNCTADEVFAYVADRQNEPDWRASTISVVTSGSPEQGSGGQTRFRFMGRAVDVDWWIAEYEENSVLAIEYASGVRGGRDRYRFEPFGRAGVTVHTEVEIFVGGLVGLVSHARRARFTDELRDDMRRVKRFLESA